MCDFFDFERFDGSGALSGLRGAGSGVTAARREAWRVLLRVE